MSAIRDNGPDWAREMEDFIKKILLCKTASRTAAARFRNRVVTLFSSDVSGLRYRDRDIDGGIDQLQGTVSNVCD